MAVEPERPDSAPSVDAQALRDCGARLAAEAARLAWSGWMRGTSGNLSVVLSRGPLRLAVTASGLDKGELSEADIVVVDADGNAVPATDGPASGARPSAEAAVHARIAALTGTGAVVHVHAVAAVYSSGSVGAQRAWFGHTPEGDLRPLVCGYSDAENGGPKKAAASYEAITGAIDCAAWQIVFLSDSAEELNAARAAGWRTVGVCRPGEPNSSLGGGDHLEISSFADLSYRAGEFSC